MKQHFARGAIVVALACSGWSAAAQPYPSKEIHSIAGFPAGTGADVFVRYFSNKLQALAGKTVIVENRTGASGNIATEYVAKSAPNGLTIMIAPGSATLAAAPHIFKSLGFDPIADFTPVTTLARIGFVIAVDAKSPVKTMAELTALLKEKNGKAAYGNNTNTALVTVELYKKAADVQATRVDYRDVASIANDMAGGSLDFAALDATFAIGQVKAGKIRVLAITLPSRVDELPDVPTMEEAGVKGFGSLVAWWAVFVPAKTPQDIVSKLESWFNEIVASDETKTFLRSSGSVPFLGNSKLLADLLVQDTQKWGEYTRIAKIEKQ